MYLYLSATFADRIKLFIKCFVLLFLLTGDNNRRKEILWEEFELAFMQELPIHMAGFHKVKDFDVVFQQTNSSDQDIYYPDQFMIGIGKPGGSRFERVHLLSRVNPFVEYKLVKSVSDLYQSDTTYLDVLLRNRKNQLESVVYRKIKPGSITEQDTEYIMWKKERIILKKKKIKTKLIEKWNSHLFN